VYRYLMVQDWVATAPGVRGGYTLAAEKQKLVAAGQVSVAAVVPCLRLAYLVVQLVSVVAQGLSSKEY
jgi:hypothetical protein